METISLEAKAREWLAYNRKGEVAGIEVQIFKSSFGIVVYFYDEETWADLPYFLTVPMVNELMEGKNPKKVKNQYAQRRNETVETNS